MWDCGILGFFDFPKKLDQEKLQHDCRFDFVIYQEIYGERNLKIPQSAICLHQKATELILGLRDFLISLKSYIRRNLNMIVDFIFVIYQEIYGERNLKISQSAISLRQKATQSILGFS